MFRDRRLPTLVLTAALLTLPAAATAQDDSWHFRFGGAWVDPNVDFFDLDPDGDRVKVAADGALGFSLAIERQFSRRLGVELGVLLAEPELQLDLELDGFPIIVSEGIGFTAVTGGLNVHLTPEKRVDLYVAPLLVYTSFDDLNFRFRVGDETLTAAFRSDDDFAVGAQLGADVLFGEGRWSLNLTVRYLDIGLSVVDEEGVHTVLHFDPLVLGVGLGYGF